MNAYVLTRMHIVINTTHLTKIHHFYAIDNVALNRISNVFLILIFYTYLYVDIYGIFSHCF